MVDLHFGLEKRNKLGTLNQLNEMALHTSNMGLNIRDYYLMSRHRKQKYFFDRDHFLAKAQVTFEFQYADNLVNYLNR
jgi:hypothetical protein